MTPPTTARAEAAPGLTSDEALRFARLDAERAYRDLSRYSVRVALEADGWHVDYELKDPRARGGGRITSSTSAVGRSCQSATNSSEIGKPT